MSYIMDLRKHVGHSTLIMPCAVIILGDGCGNILLQQRVDDKKWSYHGGAIEVDEEVTEALKREIKEELNITLDEFNLLGIYSGPKYHHTYPNGDQVSSIEIVYYSHKFHGDIKYQPEEVLDLKWFDEETIPTNLSDNPKEPIRDYFNNIIHKRG